MADQSLRRCTKCGESKSVDEFYERRTSSDGLHTMCKACLAASNREYMQANKERVAARKRRWNEANPERAAEQHRLWLADHRDQQLERMRARRLALKIGVLRHYGPACACCGEYDARFLSIEHANGDGAAHRRAMGPVGSGGNFYEWLRKQGYPNDLGLTVLCGTCNSASHRNGGVCPHADPEAKYLVTEGCGPARVAWLETQLAIERQRAADAQAVAVGASTAQS